ncbi:hypothetical protein ABZ554_14885 [Streptomyces sp. NPDC020125]|uniref:hypothetical protein n=1 Tax=Streptomyces sp. NPDC020125 TaxID=3154593 RepID=UPI0033E71121
MEIPSERTGVLILRVWVEGGRPDGFRARIVRTEDRHQAPPTAVASTHPSRIMTMDAHWTAPSGLQ